MRFLSCLALCFLTLILSPTTQAKERYRHETQTGINGILAPMSIPFPMGFGISGHYVMNPNWILEAEYFRSNRAIKIFAFELGEIVEQKLTLQTRYFPSDDGSFNFIMGIGYRNLEARVPKDLLDLATHNYSETAAELSARFIKLGIANQWQWKEKYLVTFDWFALEVPFAAKVMESASKYADDPEDKEDIEETEHVLKWYPSGALVKFAIGITF